MKLLQRAPTGVLKLYFEVMKVLLVCVFLISRTRLLLSITSLIILEQFSILNALSKFFFLNVNHAFMPDNVNNFIPKFH